VLLRPDIGAVFIANSDQWVVSSTTNNFVIATRFSVHGEPDRSSDVIKITLTKFNKYKAGNKNEKSISRFE